MDTDMDDEFCLKWNNHHNTFITVLHSLLKKEVLVDVTLAAEGKFIEAHRLVLCTCSDYFQDALSTHVNKHAFIFLNNVAYDDLKALVDYMYKGEVNVSQEQLPRFLATAEALKIKGLSDKSDAASPENQTPSTQSKSRTSVPNKSSRMVSSPCGVLPSATSKPNRSPPHQVTNPTIESQGHSDTADRAQSENLSNSITEGLSTCDDNFIAVDANDDIDLDQTEDDVVGIGTLGRVWSMNESQLSVDWDRGASVLTDPGSSTEYSAHQDHSDSIEYQQYLDPVKSESMHDSRTLEEIIPGPSSAIGRNQWTSSSTNSPPTKGKSSGNSSGSENRFSSATKISCPTCGRVYSQKGSLNRHLKYECSIVPKFPCQLCPLRFRRAYKLTEHHARCHANEGPQPPLNNGGKTKT